MRTRELRHWWNSHQELDDAIAVVVRADADLEPIDRAVEVASDSSDRLKPDGLQLEKRRYGVLDDGDGGTGIDHHVMGNRLPLRTFFREELDIRGVRREKYLDERPLLRELARNDLPLVNALNHESGRPLTR